MEDGDEGKVGSKRHQYESVGRQDAEVWLPTECRQASWGTCLEVPQLRPKTQQREGGGASHEKAAFLLVKPSATVGWCGQGLWQGTCPPGLVWITWEQLQDHFFLIRARAPLPDFPLTSPTGSAHLGSLFKADLAHSNRGGGGVSSSSLSPGEFGDENPRRSLELPPFLILQSRAPRPHSSSRLCCSGLQRGPWPIRNNGDSTALPPAGPGV